MVSGLKDPLLTRHSDAPISSRRVIIFTFLLALSLILLKKGSNESNETDFNYAFFAGHEVPLSVISRLEQIRMNFPGAAKLCETRADVLFADISPPVTVTFVEVMSAGSFGAILRAIAEGEDIAFKLLQGFQEADEVVVLRTLIAAGMESVPKLKVGGVMHSFTKQFDKTEYAFRGFGMELFPYPTMFDYLLQQSSDKTFEERVMLLKSPIISEIFTNCINAIQQMWLIGVIHKDLHMNNILVNPSTREIKIIDFGRAVKPTSAQETQWKLGTRTDYMRFAIGFVCTTLYPDAFDSSDGGPTDAETRTAKRILREIDPEAAIPFLKADFPERSDYKRVYEGWRAVHGITGDQPAAPRYFLARPPSSQNPPPPRLPPPASDGAGPSSPILHSHSSSDSSGPGEFHSLNLTPLRIDESNFSSGTREDLERRRDRLPPVQITDGSNKSPGSSERLPSERRLAATKESCSPQNCNSNIRRLLTFRSMCRSYCSQLSTMSKSVRGQRPLQIPRNCDLQHLTEWKCTTCKRAGEMCIVGATYGHCTQIIGGMTCRREGEVINPDGMRVVPVLNEETPNEFEHLTPYKFTPQGLNLGVELNPNFQHQTAFQSGLEAYLPVVQHSEVEDSPPSLPNFHIPAAFKSGLEDQLPMAQDVMVEDSSPLVLSSPATSTLESRYKPASIEINGLIQPNSIFSHSSSTN